MSADLLCPRCKRPEYPRTMRGSVGTICMASYAPLDLAQVRDCLTLALAIARKERDGALARVATLESTLEAAQVGVCQWGCIKVEGPPSGMIHCAECQQIQLAIRGAKPGL